MDTPRQHCSSISRLCGWHALPLSSDGSADALIAVRSHPDETQLIRCSAPARTRHTFPLGWDGDRAPVSYTHLRAHETLMNL
eukprot:1054889-Prymnesium_polylepis.1